MSTVGFLTCHKKCCDTVFIVKNIANEGKRIRIFQYPIKNGYERDLLAIPYVSEADIRHSLLKGELLTKILAKEIVITKSNIDLLQFDNVQKQFLKTSGITFGTEIVSAVTTGVEIDFKFKQGIELLGNKDNTNRIFNTPENFINGEFQGNFFNISIYHNGRALAKNIDYFLVENNHNTILLNFSPKPSSVLIANYTVISI